MPTIFDFNETVEWLKSFIVDNIVGFAILDSENAIMLKKHTVKIFVNFFQYCYDHNLEPIIVGKISTIQRLKNRLPDLDFPEKIIYFFLHTDPKNCADDAFILELYANLKKICINTKICSIDKYSDRMNWKLRDSMISNTLKPDRPRSILDENTIIYKSDIELIKTIKFNDDKIIFDLD